MPWINVYRKSLPLCIVLLCDMQKKDQGGRILHLLCCGASGILFLCLSCILDLSSQCKGSFVICPWLHFGPGPHEAWFLKSLQWLFLDYHDFVSYILCGAGSVYPQVVLKMPSERTPIIGHNWYCCLLPSISTSFSLTFDLFLWGFCFSVRCVLSHQWQMSFPDLPCPIVTGLRSW